MKVQLTILINVDIDREDFVEENEILTDEEVMDRFRDKVDEGNEDLEGLIDKASDYTVTVVRGDA